MAIETALQCVVRSYRRTATAARSRVSFTSRPGSAIPRCMRCSTRRTGRVRPGWSAGALPCPATRSGNIQEVREVSGISALVSRSRCQGWIPFARATERRLCRQKAAQFRAADPRSRQSHTFCSRQCPNPEQGIPSRAASSCPLNRIPRSRRSARPPALSR